MTFLRYVLRAARSAALLIACGRADAAADTSVPQEYLIDIWQAADGLPHSSVSCITQTRDGYLWLGTQNGLVRFDGIRFQGFDSLTTPGLKSARIVTLHEDRRGRLWVGTEGGGVSWLNAGRFTPVTTREGLSHDVVRSIGEDSEGAIWVGTVAGLNRWQNGRWRQFSVKDGLPAESVSAALSDSRGGFWILAGNALCSLRDEKILPLSLNFPNLPKGEFSGIYADRASDVWVYGDSLLLLYKGNTVAASRHAPGLSGDYINALWEAHNGDIWVGTRSGDLKRLRAGQVRSFALGPGRSRYPVRAIFEDREGNLWVGTDGGGLSRLKAKPLKTWTTRDGLSSEAVLSLVEDGEGGLLVSAECGGLERWQDGKFTALKGGGELKANACVGPLLRTLDGSVWVGTFGDGLFHLEAERVEHFTREQGLLDSTILSLCEDREGALWIGTYESGLFKRQGHQFTRFGPADGLSAKRISALVQDRDGGLWIGSNGTGLYRFVDGKFSAFTMREGVGSDFIRTLFLDAQGHLWIGTGGGGLTRWAQGHFVNITTKQGLGDNVVSQILEDDFDNLWIGSSRGIFRLAKQEVRDFAAGRARGIHPVGYGKADGMESLECTGGFHPAGLKTQDGKLWFGTVKGVVMVHPLTMGWLVPGIEGDHIVFGNPTLTLGLTPKDFDLADVVGGGNGFGTATADGIDAASGRFGNASSGTRADPASRQAERFHRSANRYLDGVFIPNGGVAGDSQVVISSTGLRVALPETKGLAAGLILRQPEAAHPLTIGGVDYSEAGKKFIAMRGNQGITFDLEAIRAGTRMNIKRFRAVAGNAGVGPASFHVLVDGVLVTSQTGIYKDPDRPEANAFPIDILIPGSARFLTLVTTDDKDNVTKYNVLPPPVVIEQVLLDGVAQSPIPNVQSQAGAPRRRASIGPAPMMNIGPGWERLEINFAALSLTAPEKVRVKYRLSGFDSDWVDAAGQRTARYTKVPSGAYRFQVIACNNDGVWNETGATLALTFRPYFWQTKWFLSVASVAIVTAVGAAIRYRERRKLHVNLEMLAQQHAIEKERIRIAQDMHDELGGRLAKISFLSELAKRSIGKAEEVERRIETISATSRSVLETLDEIVWAVDPKNDTLEQLAAYIGQFGREFFQTTPIECEVKLPIYMPAYPLTAEARHNLFLAVQEALSNVLRHAHASRVRVAMSLGDSLFEILVADNGCGFNPGWVSAMAPDYHALGSETRAGHGLTNMRRRLHDIGAELAVQSEPGRGTKVFFRVRLKEAEK
jgi:ligand-binding sensor domain-containing protein/signal transduction histidine kinase